MTEEMLAESIKRAEEAYSEAKNQVEVANQPEPAPQIHENIPEEILPPVQEEEVQETEEISQEEVAEVQEETGTTNEKIRELHRQGMEQMDIAKELGIGRGIVRLVIELYEKEEPTE